MGEMLLFLLFIFICPVLGLFISKMEKDDIDKEPIREDPDVVIERISKEFYNLYAAYEVLVDENEDLKKELEELKRDRRK